MVKSLKSHVHEIRLCSSFLSKALGFMFTRKKDMALVFIFKKESIRPLHMLFVFYPIDIIFLGKNMEIVEKKQNFMPFAFYTPKNKAQYIIEMPAGRSAEFRIGEKIWF